MAKGLRASNKKANRAKLRTRVFGPIEAARTERMHAKLLELTTQPKPEPARNAGMEVDSEKETSAATTDDKASTEPAQQAEEMDIDGTKTSSKFKKVRTKGKGITKRRHRKEKNEMIFRKIVTGKRSKGGPGSSAR